MLGRKKPSGARQPAGLFPLLGILQLHEALGLLFKSLGFARSATEAAPKPADLAPNRTRFVPKPDVPPSSCHRCIPDRARGEAKSPSNFNHRAGMRAARSGLGGLRGGEWGQLGGAGCGGQRCAGDAPCPPGDGCGWHGSAGTDTALLGAEPGAGQKGNRSREWEGARRGESVSDPPPAPPERMK